MSVDTLYGFSAEVTGSRIVAHSPSKKGHRSTLFATPDFDGRGVCLASGVLAHGSLALIFSQLMIVTLPEAIVTPGEMR